MDLQQRQSDFVRKTFQVLLDRLLAVVADAVVQRRPYLERPFRQPPVIVGLAHPLARQQRHTRRPPDRVSRGRTNPPGLAAFLGTPASVRASPSQMEKARSTGCGPPPRSCSEPA